MAVVSDLIDTTEMYLRTVFELEEEGVVPMRARIAERLGQSNPTVSQTVARMERDGLVEVDGERHLRLTDAGRTMATRVMRKHRLAECLLIDVIGLDWPDVHNEACRWEHVISENVERRILELTGHPTTSPFGNPIPGLDELGDATKNGDDALVTIREAASATPTRVVVRRIGEPLQTASELMARLERAGVVPGRSVDVQATPDGVVVGSNEHTVELDRQLANLVFVQ